MTVYIEGPGGKATIQDGRVEPVYGWGERVQHSLFRALLAFLPAARQRLEDLDHQIREAQECAAVIVGGERHRQPFGEIYPEEEAADDLREHLRLAEGYVEELFE